MASKRFDPKAKAKKQKIVLAVLGVIFLGVIVYQAPTILGLFGGGSSEVATEPAPPPPPPPPGAPATAQPASASPAPAGSAQLVDSDPIAEASQSQLVTFDRFTSKDPFVQQAEKTPEGRAQAEPVSPSDPPEGIGDSAPAPEPEPQARPEQAAEGAAKISVNGVSTSVAVGRTFPEEEPIFKLVSVTKTTAKVGIVDGTYATGAPTITLKRGGKPVTLMNTADGTTYVLRLLSVG